MRRFVLIGLLASSLTGLAGASTLFTSFLGSDVGGYTTTSDLEGLQFTATASGQLGDVEFAAFALNATGPVVWPLTLYTDSGGLPGTALETWNVTVSGTGTPQTVASVVQPMITAGDVYWLIIQNTTPSAVADMGWEGYNGSSLGYDIGSFDTLATMGNAFPGGASVGVELDTSAVPEPSSFNLAGAGCLLLAAVLGIRKRYSL